MTIRHMFVAMLAVAFGFGPAEAQVPPAVSAPIALSLAEAIQRGLTRNLGVLVQEQEVRLRQGKRWQELADLLPHISAGLDERKLMFNPGAFGFPGPVVGPFNTFDARAFVSQPVVDIENLYEAKMEAARIAAEQHAYRNARDLVVTSVARFYLEASATATHLEAVRARAASAEVVLAADRSTATPGSLASRARLLSARRRLITLQNMFAKQQLALAQAIGLPHGQQFTLVDRIPFAPTPPISLDAALERAWRDRPDVHAQLARVRAADAKLRSANGSRLPTVHLLGDYGKIGVDPSTAKMTFGIAAIVRVPIIQGGNVRGKVLEAQAELAQQKARLADLRDGIYYEIRNALLDVQAAEEQVQLARDVMELSEEQLTQGHDTTLTAEEDSVSDLYAYNVAKLNLARAIGLPEESYIEFLRGDAR